MEEVLVEEARCLERGLAVVDLGVRWYRCPTDIGVQAQVRARRILERAMASRSLPRPAASSARAVAAVDNSFGELSGRTRRRLQTAAVGEEADRSPGVTVDLPVLLRVGWVAGRQPDG